MARGQDTGGLGQQITSIVNVRRVDFGECGPLQQPQSIPGRKAHAGGRLSPRRRWFIRAPQPPRARTCPHSAKVLSRRYRSVQACEGLQTQRPGLEVLLASGRDRREDWEPSNLATKKHTTPAVLD
jgi:hypothetical protein